MLMMIVQLLVFTCAYALGAADEPQSYKDIADSLLVVQSLLEQNVLSMDGNIPGLNDPRRQYTDIIYVVHDEAWSENSCRQHDYYKDYQKNINASLPFAVGNPETVINLTKQSINDIIENINPVQQVIKSVSGLADKMLIDLAVDKELKTNVEKYDNSRRVFLAAGLYATQLINDDKDYFAPNAQNLSAHNFIIKGAQSLEKIVMALTNLYLVMYEPPLC